MIIYKTIKMNFGKFIQNDAYVIVEKSLDDIPLNKLNIVCVCKSHETAKKYLTPNRIIYGPVPLHEEFKFPDPSPIDPRPYIPPFHPLGDPSFSDPFRPDFEIKPKPKPNPNPFNPDSYN